jgi:hypothetical protein
MTLDSATLEAAPGSSGRGAAGPEGGARLAQLWALVGVVALFALAVARLGGRGIETVRAGLEPGQWIALVLLTVLFVWGEGVRALQRRWVPSVLARVAALSTTHPFWQRALAPLHAMGLIGASARTMMGAWAGTAAIVVAVLVVSRFPVPWRGIVDVAVASALLWATLVLIVAGARLLRR